MNGRIMNAGSLEEIMRRLNGLAGLLQTVYESAGMSSVSEDTVGGLLDLLDGIRRDFRADIDSAEEVPA